MSLMFNPPHPGLTLRDDVLPALNLQVGEAAAQLGVTAPPCPRCSMDEQQSAQRWRCESSAGWVAITAEPLKCG